MFVKGFNYFLTSYVIKAHEFSKSFKEHPTDYAKFEKQMVKRLIEKVTVYESKFNMEFKSHMKVNEEE